MPSAQHSLRILYDGHWEGTIRSFCDIIKTSCNELLTGDVVELQCRKQILGDVFHHFLQIQVRVRLCGDSRIEDFYLRLDWRADHAPRLDESNISAWEATNSTSYVSHSSECLKDELTKLQAMLATSEGRLLHGTTSNITELAYVPKHETVSLGSLAPFFRICCEELDQCSSWLVSWLSIIAILW